MSQHPSEHPGPDGQNEVSQAALPPAGVEIATPVSRGQVLRVMALLTVAFLVGALLLRVQADRIRPLDLPLPAGWEAVSADTVRGAHRRCTGWSVATCAADHTNDRRE